jgi:hypothetical protein
MSMRYFWRQKDMGKRVNNNEVGLEGSVSFECIVAIGHKPCAHFKGESQRNGGSAECEDQNRN